MSLDCKETIREIF